MNKRLEQEFNNFIDRLAIKESLEEGVHPSMFDLQRVAERFYNLALADMRGEVEKEINGLQPLYDTRELSEYGLGAYVNLIEIKEYIDNLTK